MSTIEVELNAEEQKALVKKILNVFDSSIHPVKAVFALANAYKIVSDNCGLEVPKIDLLLNDLEESNNLH